MADYQTLVFDNSVNASEEETDLAFTYFEHFADDGYDLERLMQGMLIAISCLAQEVRQPVQ